MKLDDLQKIYDTPLFELIDRSRKVYLEHWKGGGVRLAGSGPKDECFRHIRL